MKNFFRNVLVIAFLLATSTNQAYAQLPEVWSNPACIYGDTATGVATIKGLECIFQLFINIIITILGLVVLVMIVLGAYRILGSGGDPEGLKAGKNTITYAIVGLIAAIASWMILQLIKSFTGADVTQFTIPQ